ncbi:cytochrome bd ubiquinol oxidase [Striga asiatica]|uniref:Cytochrome bd ubiquinol oxidase n=1 Tax=Striga asiatica TaxID=4170 RepID=A0A5A7QH07_STRAF|nr:cytochrome bd ubiquinol oxidase [Striga asiatica]
MLRAAIIGNHLWRREMTGCESGLDKWRWSLCMERVRLTTEIKFCCVVSNNFWEEGRLGRIDPLWRHGLQREIFSQFRIQSFSNGVCYHEMGGRPELQSLAALHMKTLSNRLKKHGFASKSSPFSPPGNSNSKLRAKFASTSSTITIAKEAPGHILRPPPNGINCNCPFKPTESCKNLSGQNFSGSAHNDGSLPMAHTLMTTRVPDEISGSGGCKRKVSFTMAFKYWHLSKSSSVMDELCPAMFFSSFFSFLMTFSCLMSSDSVHSISV